MGKKRRKKEKCLNCKTVLRNFENFCYKCGQENHQKRATVKMLFKDFTEDYFTFDSKLFKSLKPLLFNPGVLTLEYIKGKRKNYIRPIRLYIFISFFFFLTNSLINNSKEDKYNSSLISYNNTESNVLKDSSELNKKKIIDFNLKGLEKAIEESEKNGDRFTAFFYKKLFVFNTQENQNGFNDFLFEKLPIFLFFTIPILAFILFLFFYKKARFYVDHLIFSFHLMSFVFVLLIISNIIDLFSYGYLYIFDYLLIILFFIYSVISAKKSYSVTYFSSIIRLIGTTIIHMIISAIFFAAFIMLLILIN